ncbi:MAG: tetratricopeptide repeat protein [Myxococcota bacterium]
MSEQEPPVSRWLVRKSDGTELRFPSLEALKGYILSGVVAAGDVVAPEDASWARVEDLAELSALMGMIAPPAEESAALTESEPSDADQPDNVLNNVANTSTEASLGMSAEEAAVMANSPTTKPPPLPKDERVHIEEEDEPRTVYSGPPSFDHDPPSIHRDPLSDFSKAHPPLSQALVTPDKSPLEEATLNPLSRPLHTTTASEDALLSGPITHDGAGYPLSRPISRADSAPQTHEVMTLNLRRAQRRRIIIGSIVIGMLVSAGIFFAVRNIQEASLPPDEKNTEAAAEVTVVPAKAPTSPPTDEGAAPPATQEAKTTAEPEDTAKASSETQKVDAKEASSNATTDDKASASKVAGAAPEKIAPTKAPTTPAKSSVEGKAKSDTKAKATKGASKKGSGEQSQVVTPANIDGLLARAKKVRKKNPKEALRLYKIVLSKNPSHGDAMQLAARAYLQLGRSMDAIKLLKTCRKQRPRFSPCLYYLGRSYERAGQGAAAKKAYKTLVDEFPGSSLSTKARKKLGE